MAAAQRRLEPAAGPSPPESAAAMGKSIRSKIKKRLRTAKRPPLRARDLLVSPARRAPSSESSLLYYTIMYTIL